VVKCEVFKVCLPCWPEIGIQINISHTKEKRKGGRKTNKEKEKIREEQSRKSQNPCRIKKEKRW